jgi:hypothetical protein
MAGYIGWTSEIRNINETLIRKPAVSWEPE